MSKQTKFICPLCDIEFKSDPFNPKLSSFERYKKSARAKLIRHAAKKHQMHGFLGLNHAKKIKELSAEELIAVIIDGAMRREFKK